MQLDIGTHGTLLEIVEKRKLRWFGNVVRVKGTLANTILQGKYVGEKIKRKVSKTVVGRCKGMDRDIYELE